MRLGKNLLELLSAANFRIVTPQQGNKIPGTKETCAASVSVGAPASTFKFSLVFEYLWPTVLKLVDW